MRRVVAIHAHANDEHATSDTWFSDTFETMRDWPIRDYWIDVDEVLFDEPADPDEDERWVDEACDCADELCDDETSVATLRASLTVELLIDDEATNTTVIAMLFVGDLLRRLAPLDVRLTSVSIDEPGLPVPDGADLPQVMRLTMLGAELEQAEAAQANKQTVDTARLRHTIRTVTGEIAASQ